MNLAAGIKEIVSAKGIPQELILDTVEEVLTQAYKKFKGVEKINVVSDLENNLLDVFLVKEAVNEVDDQVNQIKLDEAKEILKDEELEEGQMVDLPTAPFNDFKEKEIVWVSENILNKINNIEKDVIKYEFVKKKNRLVSGTIIKIDQKGNIFIDLGKTIALLPIEEQSPVEHYEMDDMIKAVVKDVGGKSKRRVRGEISPGNVQVVLSRTSPDLVKELLAVEIPEIADGVVNIKRIVREAGYKTKIAVTSDNVDPVAPCIGPHGIRITSVVKELGGEKIDVIRYEEEPVIFIKSALTPAKVGRVIFQDENEKMAFAVVEMDQLAYAYGRRKMNVILAAKLTGWKINIKTESEVEDENIEAASVKELENIFMDGTPISELPGFNEDTIEKLSESNIFTIESLVELNEANELGNIESLTEEEIKNIKDTLSEFVEVEEEGNDEETEYEGTPLNILPDFTEGWITILQNGGIISIEDLVEAVQEDTLANVEGLEENDIKEIKRILAENVEIEE